MLSEQLPFEGETQHRDHEYCKNTVYKYNSNCTQLEALYDGFYKIIICTDTLSVHALEPSYFNGILEMNFERTKCMVHPNK